MRLNWQDPIYFRSIESSIYSGSLRLQRFKAFYRRMMTSQVSPKDSDWANTKGMSVKETNHFSRMIRSEDWEGRLLDKR